MIHSKSKPRDGNVGSATHDVASVRQIWNEFNMHGNDGKTLLSQSTAMAAVIFDFSELPGRVIAAEIGGAGGQWAESRDG